jgi:8-oxo-dGTP pyrophosphatase MutT (NUDIX family)
MVDSGAIEQLRFWLKWQTWPDAKDLIRNCGDTPYVHPYGFTVIRLHLPYIEGWQARVHFWRQANRATEPYIVHRHGGWRLLSSVLIGSVLEDTYAFTASTGGSYWEYSVEKSADNKRSTLLNTGLRAFLTGRDTVLRDVKSGIYEIAGDTFHSTASSSQDLAVTLALTEEANSSSPSRIMAEVNSSGLGFQNSEERTFETLIELADKAYARESHPADRWASFVFVVRNAKILMARTRRNPQVWMPIGGRGSASDDLPIDTARRELSEEIGIQVDADTLHYLGEEPRDVGPGSTHFWILELPERFVPTPDTEEFEEVAWWSIEECSQIELLPGTLAKLQAIRRSLQP